MSDPRFAHLSSDPRFKKVPRRERKVKIDSRFEHMFTDRRFKVQYNVDRRGRKVKQSSSEDLRKFYQLEGEVPVVAEDEDGEVPVVDEDDDGEVPVVDENEDGEVPVVDEDEDGEVPVVDENEAVSSSDSESDLSSDEQCQVVHDWGREDGVQLAEHTSHRLALCNMDWDRVDAQDIFVLSTSFKPPGGYVCNVKVYPSDFGLERMSQEDSNGPLLATSTDEYSEETLREYQLNRLKYYYAVIECDSVSTAEAIYRECDGLEYEHSGGQLDLRFIPDEMCFDDRDPKSSANETTMPANFNPASFVSSALQQSKVHLTWDETDPHRLKNTMRKFSKEDTSVMDFSAYLASDSEDSDTEARYKDLVGEDKEVEGQTTANEMEITWEPGLKGSAERLVNRKQKEANEGELTQWEKYLENRRKKKRQGKLKQPEHTAAEDETGFDDEFFQQSSTATSKRHRKKYVKEPAPQSAELELVTMGADQHFNWKDLNEDDGFTVDVHDPRFEALFESHLFAPDPSHPHYKHTKAMQAILKEKARRRDNPTSNKDYSVEPLVTRVKRKAQHKKLKRLKS